MRYFVEENARLSDKYIGYEIDVYEITEEEARNENYVVTWLEDEIDPCDYFYKQYNHTGHESGGRMFIRFLDGSIVKLRLEQ